MHIQCCEIIMISYFIFLLFKPKPDPMWGKMPPLLNNYLDW